MFVKLLERETLLASLREFQAGVVDDGGTVVFVAGEAGIGKSALVRTFCDGLPAGTAVHYGFCDALGTPRALGPLHDIARAGLDGLGRLLATGGDRHALFTAFLDLLAAGPSVTVIEDAHWADDATLDLLLFVGRRVGALPALVVVTYRSEEVGRDHPLRRVLGDLATARAVQRVNVPALSEEAVAALVASHGRDVAGLHQITGGNPFFVTETLDSPGPEVPATVRDAVLARASRLDTAARAVLDVVSLVPDRTEVQMLAKVVAAAGIDSGPGALDDAIRSGMLVSDGSTVRFRHELARRAVESDVPASDGAALHGRILEYLAAMDTIDPARLSFHAEAAGDPAAVQQHASAAGRAAAALGAHREAAAHYASALRHAEHEPPSRRAELWKRRAYAADRAGELTEALDASARAVELWRTAGEPERAAVVLARRSHILWKAGRTLLAREAADAAVAMLEPLPPGRGLAHAHAAVARMRVLAGDLPGAIAQGSTAMLHAERFGDVAALALARGVVGSAHWLTDPDRAVALLTGSLDAARQVGDALGACDALSNLGAGAGAIRRYDLADRWLDETVAWCTERDLDSGRAYGRAWQARTQFEQGRWNTAAAIADEVVAGEPQHVPARIVALTVLGRIRARRGDPDVATPLDQAWELAVQASDLQRVWPVAAARAEAAWLSGQPERIGELVGETLRRAVDLRHSWAAGELGQWQRVGGAVLAPAAWVAGPYALLAAGDATGAAQTWRELGCPYEAALADAGADDPDRQLAGLQELQRLGAWPAAEIIARGLRAQGVRSLPGRPRRATLNNPAQLTDRQVDVLELLAEGLRNIDIASRLHISAKTVDHHVSAILAKLGVGSRQEAGRWESARSDSP